MSDATAPTEVMIVVEDIKEWRGQDVVDAQGQKLGKLEEIYFDTETDRPAFAAVKSGTLTRHLTLLPLAGATVGRDHLSVSASKDQFKQAPSFATDVDLSADDERDAYAFYGLDYRPAGANARRLAKH
jgi:PRC-barrel domain